MGVGKQYVEFKLEMQNTDVPQEEVIKSLRAAVGLFPPKGSDDIHFLLDITSRFHGLRYEVQDNGEGKDPTVLFKGM